jgi:hypothetical protein
LSTAMPAPGRVKMISGAMPPIFSATTALATSSSAATPRLASRPSALTSRGVRLHAKRSVNRNGRVHRPKTSTLVGEYTALERKTPRSPETPRARARP